MTSTILGIGPETNSVSAYQCDIGPIVGTSVIIEVEVTDSEECEEDDDSLLQPKTQRQKIGEQVDPSDQQQETIFSSLNNILHPE